MRRLVVLLVLIAGGVALLVYSQYRPQPSYVSGIIEAAEIRLGSRVGGRVKTLHVKEGDVVKAGQPLVDFEPYDLLEKEQEALAQIAHREAELKRLTFGVRPEEVAQARVRYEQALAQLSLTEEGPRTEEIAAAEHRLAAAQADQRLLSTEFDRQSDLLKKGTISKSRYDVAEEGLHVAASTVEVRRNELAILKAGPRKQQVAIAKAKAEELRLAWQLAKKGFRSEEIAKAQAERDRALAALRVIRKQKGELTLLAPTNGRIDSLDLFPGDLVAPNAPVLTLLSAQNLWVRAYVPQRFLRVRVGQEVRVTLDSFPDEDIDGTLTFISGQAEFTPSNVQTPEDRAKQVYRIKVALDASKNVLRPGMTANVWLDARGLDQ